MRRSPIQTGAFGTSGEALNLSTATSILFWSCWEGRMESVSTGADMMDLGIPAMTKCCNQLDVCYDTCGANKYRCDAKFRWCLHSICSDLKRSLGFVSKVEVACDSLVDTVFNTVWTLGCRPFMNSQRAACICAEEEKEEL
ncbi:group XIIB secretory phospholipase A2-like protein isoform X4 [Rhinopithecus roxellana]|nr:group XIIB secretory phospholipase A2-like protein isoform X3 [Theropithecus gelada]XP_030796413.1 group XIIB secretory phospholipase A2-like protein isoform X4 [Rhinopithecus roxellana]